MVIDIVQETKWDFVFRLLAEQPPWASRTNCIWVRASVFIWLLHQCTHILANHSYCPRPKCRIILITVHWVLGDLFNEFQFSPNNKIFWTIPRFRGERYFIEPGCERIIHQLGRGNRDETMDGGELDKVGCCEIRRKARNFLRVCPALYLRFIWRHLSHQRTIENLWYTSCTDLLIWTLKEWSTIAAINGAENRTLS